MNALIKKELSLWNIPDKLKDEFESIILTTYFEHGHYDLYTLTGHVDIFGIYMYSDGEFGDPFFTFHNKILSPEEQVDILEASYSEIMEDVEMVLGHHNLFFTLESFNFCPLDELHKTTCINYPSIQVW
ncbi:hypothetical protein AAXE64_27385 [Priestia megaterium]|uniref:hypothetical protein n=1 Tax=Priestia megaterium TaxID=1404 RepID=UPI003D08C1A0